MRLLLQVWTVQYVILQPVLCLVHMTFPDFIHGHPSVWWLMTFVYCVSATFSLSALIGFFHTFEREIKAHAPIRKLLCVKGVVAVCFYQNIGTPYLARYFGLEKQQERDLSDVLVAVEMGLIFSFLFAWAFFPAGADLSTGTPQPRKLKRS